MTTLLVVLLVGLTVVTLVVLAVAVVTATDRLRATVDRLLAVRGAVQPHLETLEAEAARARAHAERLRATPLRAGGRTGGRGARRGDESDAVVPSAPDDR